MNRICKTFLIGTAVLALTACGGGSSGSAGGGATTDAVKVVRPNGDTTTVTQADFLQLLDSAEKGAAAINRQPDTRSSAFPTNGSATFRGQGGLFIENAPRRSSDDLSILGQTQLTANFGSGNVRGRMTNLVGAKGTNPSNGDLVEIVGDIDFGTNASQIGAPDNNDFSSNYSGNLRTSGEGRYAVSGTIRGRFVGTNSANAGRPGAIRGLTAKDDNIKILRNGRRVDGALAIFGSN